jgi:hypothetical protein
MGTCGLCGAELPDEEAGRHLLDEHGVDVNEAESWPDGAPVVYDRTLEPTDFEP